MRKWVVIALPCVHGRLFQVWFPDSADKTAQAIYAFNREELPLMVLGNWRGFSGGINWLSLCQHLIDELCVLS